MRRFLIVFLFVLLAPAWLSAQESRKEPSLVELVRRQKGQQKETAGKKKVTITNADLRTFRRARVATSSARHLPTASDEESTPQAETKDSPLESSPQSRENMEFWKSALKEARLNLKNTVNRGLSLQLQMNNLRNAFFAEADGASRNVIQAGVDDALRRLDENRLEVEEAKKALATLQKEARKSGVAESMIRELTKEISDSAEIGLPGFSGFRVSDEDTGR